MHSEDEQRELALREQELLDDPAWRESVRRLENPLWRHRWPLRALAGFGVLFVPAGGPFADGGMATEGVLIAGGAALCLWTNGRGSTRGWQGPGRGHPEHVDSPDQ